MAACTSLTTLNLAPLYKITTINPMFLTGCTGLEHLDLTPLVNVGSIPSRFMWECSGLRTINLSGLHNVQEIPSGFLSGCTALTTLDTSPFTNVTVIPGEFMKGCIGLTSIDLSGLSGVTTIYEGFLMGCTGLTMIATTKSKSTSSSSPPIRNRKDSVADSASTIRSSSGVVGMDLSGLVGVDTLVMEGFLAGCAGLLSSSGDNIRLGGIWRAMLPRADEMETVLVQIQANMRKVLIK
jgi:hypothetical protein